MEEVTSRMMIHLENSTSTQSEFAEKLFLGLRLFVKKLVADAEKRQIEEKLSDGFAKIEIEGIAVREIKVNLKTFRFLCRKLDLKLEIEPNDTFLWGARFIVDNSMADGEIIFIGDN